MWVPLAVRGRIIGGIGVAHEKRNYFTAHQADLALSVANQAAITMINSELYGRAQALAVLEERQRLARNLHDAVNQSLFSAGLFAEVLPRLWDRDQAEARRSLEDLRRLTRGAGLLMLAMFVLIVWATALGLLLAAVNVYLRDVQYLVEVGLLLWFWGTPIVYAWSQIRNNVGEDHQTLFQIYLLNPMTNVIFAFQRVLWPAGEGTKIIYPGNLWLRLGVLAIIGIVLLCICQRIFARLQGSFAQEL